MLRKISRKRNLFIFALSKVTSFSNLVISSLVSLCALLINKTSTFVLSRVFRAAFIELISVCASSLNLLNSLSFADKSVLNSSKYTKFVSSTLLPANIFLFSSICKLRLFISSFSAL